MLAELLPTMQPRCPGLAHSEVGDRTFDEVMTAGRKRWNDVLGRIEVEDDNVDHLRTFYSCLYRSVLFPRAFYEKNAKGEVMHYSPYNGEVKPGYMFTDTGFWDTRRVLKPTMAPVWLSVALSCPSLMVPLATVAL